MIAPLPRANLDDLARVDGKAELIAGRIVHFMPTGHRPGRIAFRIARSLDDYAEERGAGFAYGDNVGFAVGELRSGRQSFSPDAAFIDGAPPQNAMRFVQGAPIFAAEVRSEGDYGRAAEEEMAAKRADYFEAGTKVVWDVDPEANLIRSYDARTPDQSVIFAPGQKADARAAIDGWSLDVEHLFREP
jgi:Uma2 family endonuclease